MFIAIAITARADVLVSGGGDLAVLRAAAPVPILSVGELRDRVR